METKDTIVINCLKDLVEHNTGMVDFCQEAQHGEALTNYYEGKVDAYTRVLDMFKDFERMTTS